MSRLESERHSRSFSIKNEQSTDEVQRFPIKEEKMRALPITRSVEAVEAFDREQESPPVAAPSDAQSCQEPELLNNAKILLQAREYRLVQSLLRKVLAKNSRHKLAIKWMGDALKGEGHLDEAARCYSELLRIEENTENHLRAAEVYYEMGQDEEALNHYFQALEGLRGEEPELFEIFKNVGNIQVRSGDYESAEENYNRAYTLNPHSDTLLVNYGTLEIQRGDLERAVSRFRQAVELNPASDKAWVGLALVHRQFGDLELSWGNLERSMDLNPENETALNLAIEWALKDGRMAQLIDRLENYLQRRDQDAAKSLTLAKLLYSSGRFRQASIELERTLLLEPTSSQALTLKSMVDGELKRQKERFN
ncbi:MAG: tetratricopeptide repeat protein [Bdellovibrionaceae bacterium]|nr:tetratricopeptide repeat protein [Bdellovibrionales bacterium]MCB9084842.1 tetratricopeptide repeat protein [Pseudobdellovibrionaceae bacterium]